MHSATCRIYKGSLLTLLKMKKEDKKAKAEPKQEKWQWLIEPQSAFMHQPGELFQDSIIFIALALATCLVAIYLYAINFVFLFVRWGSLALLILTFATIVYTFKMIGHLIHGIARLRKPYKLVIFIALLIGALLVIFYRDAIIPPFIRWLWKIPWFNLNPLAIWRYPYY
jgi:hypothetical protein